MIPAGPLTTDRAVGILSAVAGIRALVVGDCMLDRYMVGSVDRVSPEAPVPVLKVQEERDVPGGAANVAAGIVALGGVCRLVGIVGDDPAGASLRRLLKRHDVDFSGLITDPNRTTTVKTRALAGHQQVLRIDREETRPLASAVKKAVQGQAVSSLDWADVVVLEDYDKGVLEPEWATELLSLAKQKGIPSVVDPKLRHFFDYRSPTIFKPNSREVATALGLEEAPTTREGLAPVIKRTGCEHLVMTQGEAGMLVLGCRDADITWISSEAREVYDVTGAGDTVTAVLAVGLAAGVPVVDCAALANLAAGLEISRLGAVPISTDEITKALLLDR